MKKSKKIMMIAAAVMIAVGLVLSLGAMFAMKFDFSAMNTVSYETKTYTVGEAFSGVAVDETACDVRFCASNDGECKVICQESENISYSVAVEEGILHIERRDERRWYECIGVYFGEQEVSVYLPESSYKSLAANTRSGSLTVPQGFYFDTVDVQSTSGNIDLCVLAGGDLSAKTNSGNLHIDGSSAVALTAQTGSGGITLENTSASGDITVKTSSGNIILGEVKGKTVSAEAKSGNINFIGVIADESIDIENGSGNVELQRSDAASLSIKTNSGGVSGTLLTDKIYLANSSTGNVNVPKSVSGGKCEISTGSGNIDFH